MWWLYLVASSVVVCVVGALTVLLLGLLVVWHCGGYSVGRLTVRLSTFVVS